MNRRIVMAMRTLADNGKETKTIEAWDIDVYVGSYQSSTNLKDDGNIVNVEWISKKGNLEGMRQILH